MITIGRMPRKTQRFFKPLHDHFARAAWNHFWGLVVAMTISQLKTWMRQIVWREAVEDVVKHSHEKRILHRLEKLLAA